MTPAQSLYLSPPKQLILGEIWTQTPFLPHPVHQMHEIRTAGCNGLRKIDFLSVLIKFAKNPPCHTNALYAVPSFNSCILDKRQALSDFSKLAMWASGIMRWTWSVTSWVQHLHVPWADYFCHLSMWVHKYHAPVFVSSACSQKNRAQEMTPAQSIYLSPPKRVQRLEKN